MICLLLVMVNLDYTYSHLVSNRKVDFITPCCDNRNQHPNLRCLSLRFCEYHQSIIYLYISLFLNLYDFQNLQESAFACPVEKDLQGLICVKESFEKRWIQLETRVEFMQSQIEGKTNGLWKGDTSVNISSKNVKEGLTKESMIQVACIPKQRNQVC